MSGPGEKTGHGPLGARECTARLPRRPAFAFGLAMVILAAGVFFAVAATMRVLEREAIRATLVHDQLTPSGQIRPTAEVAEAVRQMKLVTVEINSRVTATIANESWRGDVSARVAAPVRLLYGADLSRLEETSIAYSPVTRSYALRVPAPQRIATEVCATDEEIDVQVGWLRLRSRAGEYYLGLARRSLYERARELVLSPEDAAMVREATKRQIEAMVRRIVGRDAGVVVHFDDGAPW